MIWELSPWKRKPYVSDRKTKETHRSSATSEDYCHRKKITSLIDSGGESETQKFATTKQLHHVNSINAELFKEEHGLALPSRFSSPLV
ncbi:hypothetical protein OUZ56_000574 [Daphnia magna]|uniref:Uncharacterized protein n=1 Tax=Daphnia magna TaxID=35525 RepID=A0ABR0A040_9CRUS|nr:hypothetical protein OUZ56_000574 [Daphnia magna]